MFIPFPLRRHGQDQQELEKIVTEKLTYFILSLMREYFKLTESRIEQEVCGFNRVYTFAIEATEILICA